MHPLKQHRWLAFFLGIGLFGVSGRASAQVTGVPTGSELEQNRRAVTLAHEGKRLFEAGDYEGALGAFEESGRLTPSPVTELYVARSKRALGKWLDAQACYTAIVSGEIDTSIGAFQNAQARATEELRQLESQIPHLQVELRGLRDAASVRVQLDGLSIENWSVGIALDPGQHRLLVFAQGRTEERALHLQPGQTLVIQMDLVDPEAASQAVRRGTDAPEARKPASAEAIQPESAEARVSLRPWAWTAVGISASALVAGGILGGVVLVNGDQLHGYCNEVTCPGGTPRDPSHRSQLSTSLDLATAADVAFVAAGVATIAAVTLWTVELSWGARGQKAKFAWIGPALCLDAGGREPRIPAYATLRLKWGPASLGIAGTF